VSDDDSGALAVGARRSGSVTLGDLDVYTIDAFASPNVTINFRNAFESGLNLRAMLFDASGQVVRDDTGDGTWSLTSVPGGARYTLVLIDLFSFNAGPYSVGVNVAAGNDTAPPRAIEANYAFDADDPAARLFLSEDVEASFSASDVRVVNLDTGQPADPALVEITYGESFSLISVVMPRPFHDAVPDGNYRVTLPAGSVADASGNALAGDVVLDFFILAGDANRDRRVDLADFNVLASHFGKFNRTFSQGDFDYESGVDLDDFNLLAARFGRQVAPASVPMRAGVSSRLKDALDDLLA
jgi:hypothetical protein